MSHGLSLDELIEYNVDEKEIQDMIDQTDDNILFLPPIKRKWIWQDTQNS